MGTTIADIAREAGVSLATVSRVLNEKTEGVGVETRQRIKDIIARLSYEPCGVARGLATGKSRSVGLVLPDIADPFFPLLIRGIEDALLRRGYGLFLCDSAGDIEKEKEHIRILLEKRIDGVILNPVLSDGDRQLDLLDKRGIPYVLLDRMIEARATAAGVYCDNRLGARLAVDYLLEGGVRRLLFVNGPAELTISALRGAGVDDAFQARSLDPSATVVVNGDYSVESGQRAVEAVLASSDGRPVVDAVFAANDRMAIGAMKALKRRGLRIPDDIEVVGFDDIGIVSWMEPPLTTVAQPAFAMGRESAELLLRLAEGVKPRRRIIILEPSLVVRGTTKPR